MPENRPNRQKAFQKAFQTYHQKVKQKDKQIDDYIVDLGALGIEILIADARQRGCCHDFAFARDLRSCPVADYMSQACSWLHLTTEIVFSRASKAALANRPEISAGKSAGKSARKSARKNVRKSVRKSARKSVRKSVRRNAGRPPEKIPEKKNAPSL